MALKRFTPDAFIAYMDACNDQRHTVFNGVREEYSKDFIKTTEFSVMCNENLLIEIELNDKKPDEFFIRKNATLRKTKEINAYLNSEEEDNG